MLLRPLVLLPLRVKKPRLAVELPLLAWLLTVLAPLTFSLDFVLGGVTTEELLAMFESSVTSTSSASLNHFLRRV